MHANLLATISHLYSLTCLLSYSPLLTIASPSLTDWLVYVLNNPLLVELCVQIIRDKLRAPHDEDRFEMPFEFKYGHIASLYAQARTKMSPHVPIRSPSDVYALSAMHVRLLRVCAFTPELWKHFSKPLWSI